MDTSPQPQINLAAYSRGDFDRGASIFREALWVLVSFWLFRLCPFKFSALKRLALRCFGARVGRGVIIKPNLRITFPWKLTLGNDVWLGEECWLLNLAPIVIEDNVCISQRAFLCAGNHNYKSLNFDLTTQPVRVENSAWIGANAFVGPGVTVGARSVVCAGSVVTETLPADGIFRGNPAIWLKRRVISSKT